MRVKNARPEKGLEAVSKPFSLVGVLEYWSDGVTERSDDDAFLPITPVPTLQHIVSAKLNDFEQP